MNIFNKKLILASQSPRRKQLLAEAGFEFEIKLTDVEEMYPDNLFSEEVPEYLAHKKAAANAHFLEDDDTIIIASDCVVILHDVIYGKPTDYEDAFMILQTLSGCIHDVVTGVCLMSKQKTVTFKGVSRVHFDTISDEEIEYYLKKYKPYDKAGAYAIQEWIGLCKISKIEGTYSNIMGLPMDLVYKGLMSF
jgi:septum formation protein